MGCHTWFYRPVTTEEFNWLKEYALEDAIRCFTYEYIWDAKKEEERDITTDEAMQLMSTDDKYCLDLIKKSIKTDEPCYYGMTWYEAGYGTGNPKFIEKYGAKPHIYYVKDRSRKGKEHKKRAGREALYIDVCFEMGYLDKIYNGMTYEEFNKSDIWKQVDFPYFHDVFRLYTYPSKVIHNTRELRRYLGKKYFELSDYQRNRVSTFFKMYPGGIINFG